MKKRYMNQGKNIWTPMSKLLICLLVFFFTGCNEAQNKYIMGTSEEPFNIENVDFSIKIDTLLSKYQGEEYYKIPISDDSTPNQAIIGYAYQWVDNSKQFFYFYNKKVKIHILTIITDTQGNIYSFTGSADMPKLESNPIIEKYNQKNSEYKIDNQLSIGIRKSMEQNDMHLYQYIFPDKYVLISLQKQENINNHFIKLSVRNNKMPNEKLSNQVKTYY